MSASACSRSMTDSVYYFMSDKKFHVYLCPFRTRSWRRHCPIHDVEMAAAAAYSDQRQRPLVAERPTASQSSLSLCSIVSIADAVTRAAEAGHGCDADVERERERERGGEKESQLTVGRRVPTRRHHLSDFMTTELGRPLYHIHYSLRPPAVRRPGRGASLAQ